MSFIVQAIVLVSSTLVFVINGKEIRLSEPTLSTYPRTTTETTSAAHIINTTLSTQHDMTAVTKETFSSSYNGFPVSSSAETILTETTVQIFNTTSSVPQDNPTGINTTLTSINIDDSNVTVTDSTRQPSRPRQRSGYGFDASIIHSGWVSEDQYNSLKSVTRYIMFVIPIFGMGLNCFNIIIFSRPQMRTESSRMLVCLGSAEFSAVALTAIQIFVEAAYGNISLYTSTYLYMVIFFSMYGITIVSRTTFCYIFYISAERLLAVVFPLKAKHIKLIQKPVVAFIVMLIVISIYHVYFTFKYYVVGYETANNRTRYRLAPSSYYVNYETLFDALLLAGDIVFVFIPLFGCLILNVFLSIALRRHRRLMKEMSSTQDPRQMNRADKQITVTILVSSVVFTLLVLPVQIIPVIPMVATDYGIYKKQHFLFLLVLEIQSVLNQLAYCTNFICYYALGGRFRKTFHAIFCHYRPGAQQQSNVANEIPSVQRNIPTTSNRSQSQLS